MQPSTTTLDNDNGDWDETTVLLDNPEVLVIQQHDKDGNVRHEVHLSPKMVADLGHALTQWVGAPKSVNRKETKWNTNSPSHIWRPEQL